MSEFQARVEAVPPATRFLGAAYDPALDLTRLTVQIVRLYILMRDARWRTLREIAAETNIPESSASAHLRSLRKPKFGGYRVDRRRRGEGTDGLFEYRVWRPEPGQMVLL